MQSEKDNSISVKRLSNDNDYYNNVFKKTEKIVSVIFYILSETSNSSLSDVHIQIIKDRALKTHELSLETLSFQKHEQHAGLLQFQYGLVGLLSTMRIAETAKVIPAEIFTLLSDQMDTVIRYINNHYLVKEGISRDVFTERDNGGLELRPNPRLRHQRHHQPGKGG